MNSFKMNSFITIMDIKNFMNILMGLFHPAKALVMLVELFLLQLMGTMY